MAYLAPNWFTRKVFNPTAMSLPVIAAYRDSVGREVERYFDRLPDAADHPVFLVDAGV